MFNGIGNTVLIVSFANFRKVLGTSLQTQHVYSTLKWRVNDRFHIISTWNTRGVFVGLKEKIQLINKV